MIEVYKNRVLSGKSLCFDEVVELVNNKDKEALYKAADEIRAYFNGNKIDLCSITNAKSGSCSEDCKWCSQSAFYNTGVETYDVIDRERALKEVRHNSSKGVKRQSLVTSGKRITKKTLDKLIPIFNEITNLTDMKLCASMGLIDEELMGYLVEKTGIEHYHCNLETSKSFFPSLCKTHSYDEKVATIKHARKFGIKICSGGIIGMGETILDRIELAFSLKELDVESIPINILNPVKGTPLEGTKRLSEEDILTTFSMFRFINPTAKIRFAGGRMSIKKFQDKALHAGINGALSGDYLTSIGSDIEEDIKDFTASGFDLS